MLCCVVLCNVQGPRRHAGDLEFAVRSGIDDLNASWSAVLPNLALTYPFELDTFQKEAVIHLEQGHSVCVYGVQPTAGCLINLQVWAGTP